MMLKSVGMYLLQKRHHAVWVALLCAFLPFLYLPTFTLAVIIIGLVTLHKGAREGFIVLCWTMLGAAASFYGSTDALFRESISIGIGLAIWLMACVLGYTAKWATALQLAVAGGVLTVIAIRLFALDAVREGWLHYLMPYVTQTSPTLDPNQVKAVLMTVTSFVIGGTVAGLLAFATVLLLVARGWQALLFNPGGMSQEWRQLRLDYRYSSLAVLVLIGVCFRVTWLMDVFAVVLMPFIFAGLSLVHAKVMDKKAVRMPVLIALYTSMLLFPPYISIALTIVAFIDSWYDFRLLHNTSGQNKL